MIIHILLLLFCSLQLFGLESQPDPVKFELIAENQTIQPGEPFWIALRINMDKNTHSYWKNPGDAGSPLEIEWKLPPGYQVGNTEWPYPKRFELNSLVGYGYEGEIWLLTPVIPPSNAQGLANLSAQVTWLVCDENSCIPGTSTVETQLPIASIPPQPKLDWVASFAKARALLPKKQWTVQAERKENLIELKLSSLHKQNALFSGVDFFPEHNNVIDHQAEAVLTQNGGEYKVILRDNSAQKEKGNQLKGVIVLYPGAGTDQAAEAFEVDVALAGTLPEEEIAYLDGPKFQGLDHSIQFEGGVLFALFLAFIGGMILNLMPCVLPVISFKVLSFVKMAGQSRTVTLKHGGSFAFGVILSFWILAGVMLLLQAYGRSVGWGFQLQEPLFVAFLAALLLIFGLSLFGVFELGASIMGMANQIQSEKKGLVSSFLSGMLATAVATPCTGPFLGSAIGFAVTLPALQALFIFTSLGFGMAFPYLALALFPSCLRFLPKPGAWMITFKELMGFLLIATVLWLSWVFGAQTSNLGMILLLTAFFSLATACWILGKWGNPVQSKISRRISHVFVAVLFLFSGYIIVQSASPLIAAESSKSSSEEWIPFSEEKVVELQKKGIPVLIDFTAKWCLICQANHLVLSTKEVSAKLDKLGVVRMKADWTRNDPKITEALRKFGRNGVPLYLLYGNQPGKAPEILPQVLTPDNVLEYLEKIK